MRDIMFVFSFRNKLRTSQPRPTKDFRYFAIKVFSQLRNLRLRDIMFVFVFRTLALLQV